MRTWLGLGLGLGLELGLGSGLRLGLGLDVAHADRHHQHIGGSGDAFASASLEEPRQCLKARPRPTHRQEFGSISPPRRLGHLELGLGRVPLGLVGEAWDGLRQHGARALAAVVARLARLACLR